MLAHFYFIVALILVITIHEFSHAWVARRLGDPTAQLQGRVTLNPLAHLDVLGTLMLFLINIGWGKPVPVNPHYFRNPKRDNALTALAGPLSNLLMALALAVVLKYFVVYLHPELNRLLATVLDVNILLFAFNMLPFPPLDGSKIIGILIPDAYQFYYQRYLKNAVGYFIGFLLIDQFILERTFHFSLLQFFIGNIFVFIRAVLFLGS